MPLSMNDLILQRKFLHEKKINGSLTDNFIESIDVTDTDVIITRRVGGVESTTTFPKGLKYLTYNDTTKRIEASRAIETTLSSFFLRFQ